MHGKIPLEEQQVTKGTRHEGYWVLLSASVDAYVCVRAEKETITYLRVKSLHAVFEATGHRRQVDPDDEQWPRVNRSHRYGSPFMR